jgi:hypothetical protein
MRRAFVFVLCLGCDAVPELKFVDGSVLVDATADTQGSDAPMSLGYCSGDAGPPPGGICCGAVGCVAKGPMLCTQLCPTCIATCYRDAGISDICCVSMGMSVSCVPQGRVCP